MKIAIVGAGINGLTLGYYLTKKGHQVIIYEKENYVGGLAAGFKAGDWYIDNLFHHLFKSDNDFLDLAKEIGFSSSDWLWRPGGTPIFWRGKIYNFTTPKDLLTFSPLSFKSRLKTGLVSFYLKMTKNYQPLENYRAWQWLKEKMGEDSWRIIWQPLMRKKFSYFYKHISMVWMWARVHKRSNFLGYPRGGFQLILNRLAAKIKEKGGVIKTGSKIISLSQLKNFDKIIFTGAPELFLKIASDSLPQSYQQKIKKIKYLGAVVLLLKTKFPLTKNIYWLNINETKLPFVVLVEHTNFVDKKFYNNKHWIYLGGYFPQTNPIFRLSDQKIFQKWTTFLPAINPKFDLKWVENFYVFKEKWAQPIFKIGYKKIIPRFETPIKNVYLLTMAQIYPWDRGLNQGVGLVKKFVKENFIN